MASSQIHPRRRPQMGAGPHVETRDLQFRKSSTFHSPTGLLSELCDPIDHARYLPRRSPTSPQDLEGLLAQGPSRHLQLQNILDSFDKAVSGNKDARCDASILRDPEVLAVPSFMLASSVADFDPMDIDKKIAPVDHHHASDSGMGTSISEGVDVKSALRSSTRLSVHSSVISNRSAVTQSFSTVDAIDNNFRRALSKQAAEHIENRIIRPILAEPALKDFHPLVKDVPRRIGAKVISNLRDLEKTLIFLAPEYSATAKSYLRFCERSVICIQATVDFLNEPDRRLPTDRPYTNGYFLDLIEQIRRYAAIMAETRKKEAAGENLDEMDYSKDETVILRGGLSHNGRPVELVRQKNGKTIPITAESPEDASASPATMKRSFAGDEVEDDGVRRSMARRRKSDKPGDVVHVCHDCKKEFKRPCDLTKHEKTHSRPWKCRDPKCKFHLEGWPTEKERDRHWSDKHSAAPPKHECLWKCGYASKRESNCKQHMEKQHGYDYVRSKGNGRRRGTEATGQTPQTPLTPVMNTPGSALFAVATPLTAYDPSPSVQLHHDFDADQFGLDSAAGFGDFELYGRRGSGTTAGTGFTYSSSHSPDQPMITPEEMDFDYNPAVPAPFDFNPSYNLSGLHLQQPTPAITSMDAGFNYTPAEVPELSPNGQANITLFTPHDNFMADEGFHDGFAATTDFTLFPSDHGADYGVPAGADMIGDYANFNSVGGQFDMTTNPQTTYGNFDNDLFDFGEQ
ncbi:hypothetical protein W97_01153 [Coniosporium apollinis CBS 100218]|uniref:C2H2-type domain-containing protein n=1 Tax=Coniosporium apollinis (strain CBS 100218) TaxID=1168221 RepID=R7YJ49_CONA1|nr:uncharacterized protein W97_01153 [Coniosporium apollinis CBS 100218]EON61935.1 hypothetical protein W97_01153 [Coniosporium apollinis CBS 100218]